MCGGDCVVRGVCESPRRSFRKTPCLNATDGAEVVSVWRFLGVTFAARSLAENDRELALKQVVSLSAAGRRRQGAMVLLLAVAVFFLYAMRGLLLAPARRLPLIG